MLSTSLTLVSLSLLLEISYAQTPQARKQALQELHRLLCSNSRSHNTTNHHHHQNNNDDNDTFLRATIFEQAADRLLCWQLTCQLQENIVDLSTVTSILECLQKLWTTTTTTTPAHQKSTKQIDEYMKHSIISLQDVLPWLLHAWEIFAKEEDDDDKNEEVAVVMVERILSILRTWCKIKDARLKSRVIESGIVDSIHNELGRVNAYSAIHSADHGEKRKGLLLGLIKDLTFRASQFEKEFLYGEFRDIILENCCDQESALGVIESMSATLWNLASDLGRIMAQDEQIWETLQQLWSTSVETKRIVCHRNVSSTVGTIVSSISSKNESAIALFQKQSWLLPALVEVLMNETDMDWRRRCMRTIRCLASSEWGRDFLWTHTSSVEDLVTTLLRVLQNEQDDSDTRVQAAQAISSILSFKGEDIVPLGPVLETTLIYILTDRQSDEKLVLAATQTLCASLRHSPWKRSHTTLLTETLMQRIHFTLGTKRDDHVCHNTFSDLLMQLYQDPSVQSDLSSFAKSPVLDTLTLLIEPVGPDFDQSRKRAIEMVATLSSNASCRKQLAENEGLLTALVNFCLITNGPLKESAKNAILALVPEL